MPSQYNPEILDAIIEHDLDKVKSLSESNYSKEGVSLADIVDRAALHGNLEILKYLIGLGLDFNIVLARSALHLAIISSSNDSLEMIKLLIENGSNVNEMSKLFRTPLYDAIALGRLEAVKLLIEKGADVNLLSLKRETPLHTAIKNRNFEMVVTLLKSGAEPDNDLVRTAMDHDDSEMLEVLIKSVVKLNYKIDDD